MPLIEHTRAALAEDGALAQRLPGYRPRPAQQRLAEVIAGAMQARGSLIAEAGTGTGKTYAYLVPALLSGQRVIISTGTRALQDQLYHRDLPRVREALASPLRTALLKGRANYLCLYRMEQAKGEPRLLRGQAGRGADDARRGSRGAGRDSDATGPDSDKDATSLAAQFQQVLGWSGRTRRGDLAELTGLPEDSPLWPHVTSTAENCLGSDCPFWDACFVVRARADAQAADVVVVNHHLLLADLALKQEGFGEILPGAQCFVLDEAHQLPELAAQFFGEAVSARQLLDLARDALAECAQVNGALALLRDPLRALEQGVRELRLAMNDFPQRGTRAHALAHVDAAAAADALDAALAEVAAALGPLVETGPGFAACAERAADARRRLRRWIDGEASTDTLSLVEETANDAADDAPRFAAAAGLFGRAPAQDEPVPSFAAAAVATPDTFAVAWFELSVRGFTLRRTPLDVSHPLRAFRERSGAAWVFTSATLAVGGGFGHIARRLGLDAPETLLQPSPFDWPRQALCYLPRGLPEPHARDYGAAMIAAIRPVLHASGGRAFVLFTSHRALREAAERLAGGPWPLYVQGSAPRNVLLDAFRASGSGVLLGAASFWEGVDVAGEALSVVVIDRLPFAAPDDPVLEARLDAVRRAGGNAFRDEQLPQAVIALKQGVGRLIRTDADRGVLVLCDPRLLGKSYGRAFLDSLPPLPRTRELVDVQAFFAEGVRAWQEDDVGF